MTSRRNRLTSQRHTPGSTPDQTHAPFDELRGIDCAFMRGRWVGSGLATGHGDERNRPRARASPTTPSSSDFSNTAFPFDASQKIEVGWQPARRADSSGSCSKIPPRC